MLRLFDSPHSRRDFLSIGSLALGGLTLPALLARQAAAGTDGAAAGGANFLRDKSVVFLFMHGGPSQFETFDPKMSAPSGIRSATGEIKTQVPGITFGSTFEKLARLNDKFSIVRSFKTGDGDHNIKPIVSKASLNANVGSIYSRVAGVTDPRTGMPRNVMLFPRAVDSATQPGTRNFGKFESAGQLGAAYAPFAPGDSDAGGGGNLQNDMKLAIARDRLDDRKQLLGELDKLRRQLDSTDSLGGVDRFQQQAFDTIVGGVADAFDLAKEDPRTIARYDTAPLIHPSSISKAWNNHKNYADHCASLGKLMLLARRLCERGAGFVTVTTNFVWDMHADQNNATMTEGMQYCGVPFDHAVSAFIEDLQQRGLSEKILLVCCGEMGRTPKINAKGGRDHWGGLAPLMIYGGGLKMGLTIGESDTGGGEPHTEPITIPNLLATIMHTVFDVGALRIKRDVPSDVMRWMTEAEPIKELI